VTIGALKGQRDRNMAIAQCRADVLKPV